MSLIASITFGLIQSVSFILSLCLLIFKVFRGKKNRRVEDIVNSNLCCQTSTTVAVQGQGSG